MTERWEREGGRTGRERNRARVRKGHREMEVKREGEGEGESEVYAALSGRSLIESRAAVQLGSPLSSSSSPPVALSGPRAGQDGPQGPGLAARGIERLLLAGRWKGIL